MLYKNELHLTLCSFSSLINSFSPRRSLGSFRIISSMATAAKWLFFFSAIWGTRLYFKIIAAFKTCNSYKTNCNLRSKLNLPSRMLDTTKCLDPPLIIKGWPPIVRKPNRTHPRAKMSAGIDPITFPSSSTSSPLISSVD